ncbi:MAG: site-specific DNA-methyltransferase [Myxococcales bacterium]
MADATRLELTWVGKDNPACPERRFLLEVPTLSHHADGRTSTSDLLDNRLIHADNLLALHALEQEFTNAIKCVYIDPPFNTGQALRHYDDGVEHSRWLSLMRDRLVLLHRLLRNDGALFVEIDDTESSYLQVVLDEIFGRSNRVLTVVVRRSAATGHKAINRTPVNVSEYIHIYAKNRAAWKYKPTYVRRGDYDWAYSTRLVNPHDGHEQWRFEPLGELVAKTLGYRSARDARKALGKKPFDERIVTYALKHSEEVVRYAQPKIEAVSKAARELIGQSERDAGRVFCLRRDAFSDMYFKDGNRILFLRDKVRNGEEGGLVEPLTNWWDDIPWQGIAREGGVVFPKGKKPEKLIRRILEMSTDPGDWVLDAFAGSGTTGAVSHKMRRQWIMIEAGDHCQTHVLPRLRRVVAGEDPTGITVAEGWTGGGGFRYFRLAP